MIPSRHELTNVLGANNDLFCESLHKERHRDDFVNRHGSDLDYHCTYVHVPQVDSIVFTCTSG